MVLLVLYLAYQAGSHTGQQAIKNDVSEYMIESGITRIVYDSEELVLVDSTNLSMYIWRTFKR